jgi:hypothetical protein
VLQLGPRTQHMAHRVIHSLRQILAPGCVPLFTSDGLNFYFYALTAHFGHWLQVSRRGRKALRWQVATELIYGQVKKCYRRRKLVRVTHLLRLGTEADLTIALQRLGFSGRLNTAFMERVNLTVRHGVAWLARRTWATVKPAPQLLVHLGTVASLLSLCASLYNATSGPRVAMSARWQADGAALLAPYPSNGSGKNEPTMDSEGRTLLSLATHATLHHLSVNEVRRCHVKWQEVAW